LSQVGFELQMDSRTDTEKLALIAVIVKSLVHYCLTNSAVF